MFNLRPHHGMCIAHFAGKGYSPEFTEHMCKSNEYLRSENPTVRLTVSTDEICSKCPNNTCDGCIFEHKVYKYDRAVLSAIGLNEGDELSYLDFRALVDSKILKINKGEHICQDCEWADLCYPKDNI